MPVKKIVNDNIDKDGKIWTNFKTTPMMSTYLVAFLITDDLKNYTNSEGNFSVWSRENPLKTMKIVFETGQEAIKIFENYTNIPYAFPKQDHITIPSVSEAIENWGLITYRL